MEPLKAKNHPHGLPRLRNRANSLVVFILLALLIPSSRASAGDYYGHQQNIVGLKGQIDTMNNQMKALVDLKNRTKDVDQKRKYIEQLKTLHEDLRFEVLKYNHELNHTRFHHPEKGKEFITNYQRIEMQTIEKLQMEWGLDYLLDRTRSKMIQSYTKEKPQVEKIRTPASVAEDVKKKQKPNEAKRIILSK